MESRVVFALRARLVGMEKHKVQPSNVNSLVA